MKFIIEISKGSLIILDNNCYFEIMAQSFYDFEDLCIDLNTVIEMPNLEVIAYFFAVNKNVFNKST